MADGVGNSYGVQLATKLQMLLDQPTSDLALKLVNKDYAGEFFKIGDTVQICKVDPKSVNVEVGTSYSLNNVLPLHHQNSLELTTSFLSEN